MTSADVTRRIPVIGKPLLTLLSKIDGVFNWCFGHRYNPIYQTGPIAIGLLLVLLATGIYTFLYYQTGAPYASIQRLDQQIWLGRWVRTLHRYAADASIVVIVLHAARMFIQGRTFGARALAWISGVILTGVFLLCGWTGFVMVWDQHGLSLAREGAKILDLLPLFSEPLQHSFFEASGVPSSFFFTNLFLHLAIPLGILLGVWVHTLRVSRSIWLPERRLMIGLAVVLLMAAMIVPLRLGPKAELDAMAGQLSIDVFYSFWLPLASQIAPQWTMLLWVAAGGLSICVPWWWRPTQSVKPGPSVVNERLCEGCYQCSYDCPYEAIQMVPRQVGRGSEVVARVSPELCVSCGICAASCEPMGVGPPLRTGRDQWRYLTDQLLAKNPSDVSEDTNDLVLIACENNRAVKQWVLENQRSAITPWWVQCVGNFHMTMLRVLFRKKVKQAVVWSCPPRNCHFREGPKWLSQRLYEHREAALHKSVDISRILYLWHGPGELTVARKQIDAFVTGNPTPDGRSSTWMVMPRLIGAVALCVLILMPVVMGTNMSFGHVDSAALLRLAWRMPGGKVTTCRTRSEKELQQLPRHMRTPQECRQEFLDYRLLVALDGRAVRDKVVQAKGVHGDRPPFILEEIPMSVGQHAVSITFEATPSATSLASDMHAPKLEFHQVVQAHAGRVYRIGIDRQRQKLVGYGAYRNNK